MLSVRRTWDLVGLSASLESIDLDTGRCDDGGEKNDAGAKKSSGGERLHVSGCPPINTTLNHFDCLKAAAQAMKS